MQRNNNNTSGYTTRYGRTSSIRSNIASRNSHATERLLSAYRYRNENHRNSPSLSRRYETSGAYTAKRPENRWDVKAYSPEESTWCATAPVSLQCKAASAGPSRSNQYRPAKSLQYSNRVAKGYPLMDEERRKHRPSTKPLQINDLPVDIIQLIFLQVKPWCWRIRLESVCHRWQTNMAYADVDSFALDNESGKHGTSFCSVLRSNCVHHLKSIYVNQSSFCMDSRAWKLLGRCRNLQKLHLQCLSMVMSDIPILTGLKVLQLNSTKAIHGEKRNPAADCYSVSNNFPNLVSFHMAYNVNRSFVMCTGDKIVDLKLRIREFNSRDFEAMWSGCPSLKALYICSQKLRGISQLSDNSLLKAISFEDCPELTDNDLQKICQASSCVESLSLYGCTGLHSLNGWSCLPSLQSLCLTDLSQSLDWEQILDNIPESATLNKFSYTGCDMNDILLAALSLLLSDLESIYVFNWGPLSVTALGVKLLLSNCNSLMTLLIPYTNVGDSIFNVLMSEGANLETVGVQKCGCTKEGFLSYVQRRTEARYGGSILKNQTIRIDGFELTSDDELLLDSAMLIAHI